MERLEGAARLGLDALLQPIDRMHVLIMWMPSSPYFLSLIGRVKDKNQINQS